MEEWCNGLSGKCGISGYRLIQITAFFDALSLFIRKGMMVRKYVMVASSP